MPRRARWLVTGLAVVSVCALGAGVVGPAWLPWRARDAAEADRRALEGDWELRAYTVDGTAFPADLLGKVAVTVRDGVLRVAPGPSVSTGPDGKDTFRFGPAFEARLALDPAASPKAVGLQIGEGAMPGIYRLDGDALTICFSLDKDRPKAFQSGKDSVLRLLDLRRVKR